MLLRVLGPLGIVFALLAAAMAFLISWQEYSRHFSDRRRAFRLALRTGLVTLAFFVVSAALAGLALARIIVGGR